MVQALNASKIECPVELKDLHFCTGLDADGDVDMGKDTEIPFVCIVCGHVQSNHGWKRRNGNGVSCYYPYCQKENCLVKLTLGIEPSFWVDCGPPTHAFIPCGHMTSEKTAKYNLRLSWQHIRAVPFTNNCFSFFFFFCFLIGIMTTAIGLTQAFRTVATDSWESVHFVPPYSPMQKKRQWNSFLVLAVTRIILTAENFVVLNHLQLQWE